MHNTTMNISQLRSLGIITLHISRQQVGYKYQHENISKFKKKFTTYSFISHIKTRSNINVNVYLYHLNIQALALEIHWRKENTKNISDKRKQQEGIKIENVKYDSKLHHNIADITIDINGLNTLIPKKILDFFSRKIF